MDFIKSPGPHFFSKQELRTHKEAILKNFYATSEPPTSSSTDIAGLSKVENTTTSSDAATNLRHKEVYFDVGLALQTLKRRQHWRSLGCEAVFFAILISVFISYIFLLRYQPLQNTQNLSMNRALAYRRIITARAAYQSDPAPWYKNYYMPGESTTSYSCEGSIVYGPCTNAICLVPPPRECNLLALRKPGSPDGQRCTVSKINLDYTSIYGNADFLKFMDYMVYQSPLFDVNITRYNGTRQLRASMFNQLLVTGAMRIRVLRMNPVYCNETIDPQLMDTYQLSPWNDTKQCVPYYDVNSESTEPLDLTLADGSSTTIYYNTSQQLSQYTINPQNLSEPTTYISPVPKNLYPSTTAKTGYGWGGYVLDLPVGNRCAAAKIWQLYRNSALFVSRFGTSAVFVSFSVFNPTLDAVTYSTYVSEFSPAGGIVTNVDVRTYSRLLKQEASQEQTGAGLWTASVVITILLLAYYVYLIMTDLRYCNRGGGAQYIRGWALIDLVYVALMLSTLFYLTVPEGNETWAILNAMTNPTFMDYASSVTLGGTNVYIPYYNSVSEIGRTESLMLGVTLVFSGVKGSKYLALSRRIGTFWDVVILGRDHLIGWLLLFISLFLVFSMSAAFTYGPVSYAFIDVGESMTSTALYLIGVFSTNLFGAHPASIFSSYISQSAFDDFTSIMRFRHVSRYTTQGLDEPAVWTIALIIVFQWILLNLLLAIIMTAYSQAVGAVATIENSEFIPEGKAGLRGIIRGSHGVLRGFFYTWRDETSVLTRLSTDSRILQRGYLHRDELRLVLQETIASSRVEEVLDDFMSVYAFELSRVTESYLISKRIENLVEQPAKEDDVSETKLETTDILEINDEDEFDPAAEEKWIKSLLNGDAVSSMGYVRNVVQGMQTEKLLRLLQSLEEEQNKILAEFKAAERLLLSENGYQSKRPSGIASKLLNPWSSEKKNGVEKITSKETTVFRAHHTTESGVYRYIGEFKTFNEAERAYHNVRDLVASREEHDRLAKSRKTKTSVSRQVDESEVEAAVQCDSCASCCESFTFSCSSFWWSLLTCRFLSYDADKVATLSPTGTWLDQDGNDILDITTPREIIPAVR